MRIILVLKEAKPLAEKYLLLLKPLCFRAEIAGSIRREKPEVKDIEIVCIPRMSTIRDFIDLVNSWHKIKGEPIGKYTRRMLYEGIALDLFMANENNWGLIFAIRTGSAHFSHWLAVKWSQLGYKSKDGILSDKTGNKFYFKEEEELFDFLKVPYFSPRDREVAR